ncbi:hypothetical protein SALBM217S_03198 [Streptomyces griseoloalbus]
MFPGQPVIVTSDADWQDQVRRATGGGGARAVLDGVGGSLTRGRGLPLAEADRDTYYAGGERGVCRLSRRRS